MSAQVVQVATSLERDRSAYHTWLYSDLNSPGIQVIIWIVKWTQSLAELIMTEDKKAIIGGPRFKSSELSRSLCDRNVVTHSSSSHPQEYIVFFWPPFQYVSSFQSS